MGLKLLSQKFFLKHQKIGSKTDGESGETLAPQSMIKLNLSLKYLPEIGTDWCFSNLSEDQNHLEGLSKQGLLGF